MFQHPHQLQHHVLTTFVQRVLMEYAVPLDDHRKYGNLQKSNNALIVYVRPISMEYAVRMQLREGNRS